MIIEDSYSEEWLDKASEDTDLYELVDRLGTLDVLAEAIYRAVKTSNYSTEGITCLISQLDSITHELENIKSAYELDISNCWLYKNKLFIGEVYDKIRDFENVR